MISDFSVTLPILGILGLLVGLCISTRMPKATRKTLREGHRVTSSGDAASSSRGSNPKDSHLFTDDNPSTTLAGTGFKDRQAAQRTLQLVGNRSLTYQYQVINTMCARARTHSHQTPAMREAAALFHEWMTITYPLAKDSLRAGGGFKPVLPKEVLANLRGEMVDKGLTQNDLRFVDFYINLGRGLRLANQLVDPKKPGERDWDVERYQSLCRLVPEDKETIDDWQYSELWDDNKMPTTKHLKLIAWGWTPVSNRTMVSKFGTK
jgi:hypothetical protein